MLREIYCDAFHQKRIMFTDGFNVVLGTPTGTNSIGKSTFILIIDFVLGGDTYSRSEDILQNVEAHRICWTLSFDETEYYFARRMPDSNYIEKCNQQYLEYDKISVSDYCKWLRGKTNLTIEGLSFRDAVSRYIRAYGKDNCSEKKPLQASSRESDEKASIALLKLFDLFSPVSALQSRAVQSDEEYKAFTRAQELSFISKIGKQQYNVNEKEIHKIEIELAKLEEDLGHNLMDVDALASEKAIEIKKEISKAKRSRSSLLSRLATIDDNLNYAFSITSDTYKELSRYFPDVKLSSIEELELFHREIAAIFKQELNEENAQLTRAIKEYDLLIDSLEGQIKQLVQDPNISKLVLEKHACNLKELERMRDENSAYEKANELKIQRNEDRQNLEEIKISQFAKLQDKINEKMKQINKDIYEEEYNAPILHFNSNTYRFFTPNDTGTGIAYKGLVVFDLAVLNLTQLPILAHDSIVLKQISDEAIENIMEQYIRSGKQVVIALDKQDSYSPKTTRILEDNAILRLASNGEELFGRSWGHK